MSDLLFIESASLSKYFREKLSNPTEKPFAGAFIVGYYEGTYKNHTGALDAKRFIRRFPKYTRSHGC